MGSSGHPPFFRKIEATQSLLQGFSDTLCVKTKMKRLRYNPFHKSSKLPFTLFDAQDAFLASDKTSRALPSNNQAVCLKDLIRPYHSVRINRDLLRQFTHRRKLVARLVITPGDRPLDLKDDLLENRFC